MTITVRRATDADVLGMFKLCVQMHETTLYSRYRFSPEKCVSQIIGWIANALALVAMNGDEAVGMMVATRRGLWFSDDEVAGEDVIYVREDARGSRAAFLLVREFKEWAAAQGVVDARAGVTTGHTSAGRLYEHFGGRNVGSNYLFDFQGG
jgi:GNAT superfamily N-acetyltransferase